MAQRPIETRALGEYLTSRQKCLVMNSLMIAMFTSALAEEGHERTPLLEPELG